MIGGKFPSYSTDLPNLSALNILRHNFVGSLPLYGLSNCTLAYKIGHNSFNGTIHNWNNLNFMFNLDVTAMNLVGSIPPWNSWIAPSRVLVDYNSLSGIYI